MSATGDDDVLVAARAALLDALKALEPHRDALVLIGAQAVYLHTGAADVALAETTKDSDIAIDPRALRDDPPIERAMSDAGFHVDVTAPQPGSWISADGVPVDLLVPDSLSKPGGRRGARIPPHSKRATRRARGLEAAVADHEAMTVAALDPRDERAYALEVAGPAALLVAKLHKLGERRDNPGRLLDKDAHDIYRLLVAIPTDRLAGRLSTLRSDEVAGDVTREAVALLGELFETADSLGAAMAGRAEALVGDPDVVAAATAALASDLVEALAARSQGA
jgi:hypothetical protein